MPRKNDVYDRKRFLLALMYVSGLTHAEMAEKTGYNVQSLQSIVKSDLFQAQVDQLRKEMKESTLATVLGQIEDQAIPSLETITDIRDSLDMDPQVSRLRLDAAKFLFGDLYFDRVHPKITRNESENVTRITFDGTAMKQMMEAMAEGRGEIIEMTVIDDTAQIAVADLPPVPQKAEPIEQVIEELEAEDADV